MYPMEMLNIVNGILIKYIWPGTDQVLGRVGFGWMVDMRDMMRSEDWETSLPFTIIFLSVDLELTSTTHSFSHE